MTLDFTDFLQLLLACQSALFGGFLLLRHRRGQPSHLLLAAFLIVLALHMGINLALASTPAWLSIDIGLALGFLYGPLIYLYTRSLVYRQSAKLNRIWGHFLPAIGVLIGLVTLDSLPTQMMAGAVAAGLAAYLYLSLKLTVHHEHVLSETRATGQHLTLRWLRSIIVSLMVIGGLDFLHSFSLTHSQKWTPIFYNGLSLALLGLVTYMLFNGLRQPSLFAEISVDEDALVSNRPLPPGKEAASSEHHQRHFDMIQSAMASRSLHSDPEFTLDRLANAVGLSRRQASEAINGIGGQSFSDFVNERRIKDACAQLKDPKHDSDTILEILYSVGFSTKSNFYTAFKKNVGQTPTQFRKQARKSRIA